MDPFFHTYSIVAHDEKSGQFGVAVQSHWFNVGSLCPWVEAGVGAIAHPIFRQGQLRTTGAGSAA
jgi:uncharacterized Ntn-hydrolase superfamily protein